jgi:hypothetical protein
VRALISTIAAVVLANAQAPVRPGVECTVELVQQLDLRCSEDDPCPAFLEIADVETVGERIIIAGNIHTSSATLQSLLMISDDNGKTWTEAHARIPGGVLSSIQFLDFEAGWISGHILHPDARDPFFLITSDGGKTWRKRPVYSEPKIGTIEHFRFDSRTSGKMAVDRGRSGEDGLRHELWESLTGGDSWSIRQVDARPIPFPGGERTPVKALRIRADAPSKTFRIERQEGTQWRFVASFAVALADCKPLAPAVKEEEEEPQPEPPAAPPPASAPVKTKTVPSLNKKR